MKSEYSSDAKKLATEKLYDHFREDAGNLSYSNILIWLEAGANPMVESEGLCLLQVAQFSCTKICDAYSKYDAFVVPAIVKLLLAYGMDPRAKSELDSVKYDYGDIDLLMRSSTAMNLICSHNNNYAINIAMIYSDWMTTRPAKTFMRCWEKSVKDKILPLSLLPRDIVDIIYTLADKPWR